MRQFALVTTPGLNVREAAGVSQKIKHKLAKGNRVELTGLDKWFGPYRWVQIVYELPSTLLGCGWVYAPCLNILPPKPEPKPVRWIHPLAVALIVGLPAIVIAAIILIKGTGP